MSSSKADTLVLISGIGGFLASQVALAFLKAGYSVRGTIRSQAKADQYAAKFSSYGERLSLAIVPDIAAPGSFNEAIKGVTIFLHTASPLAASGDEDLENSTMKPALNGTLEALRAASKEPGVKKIVLTSSVASVIKVPFPGNAPGVTYSETDWNPSTYEDGVAAPSAFAAYVVSKGVAEKAAWDYMKENKPAFTLSTILPGVLYGPATQPFDYATAGITGTNRYIYMVLFTKQDPSTMTRVPPVDVRDVAHAHLLAAENPKADGERFIVTQTAFHPSQYVPFFKKQYPQLVDTMAEIPEGFQIPGSYGFDGTKIERVLGLKYRPHEETLKDTADWILSVIPASAT